MLEGSQRSDSGQADRIRACVVRIPLKLSLAPQRAALLVRGDARPFALVGRWAGGGALVSSEPIRVAAPDEDPFELLDSQPPMAGRGGGAVGGGWFGYLGYELGRALEPVGAAPPGDRLPPFELALYDHLLRCDTSGRWWFEALWTEARAAALDARLRELTARAAGMPGPRPFATEPWLATPAVAGHKLAVSACRRRIYAGDLFQANVCVRLQSRLDAIPSTCSPPPSRRWRRIARRSWPGRGARSRACRRSCSSSAAVAACAARRSRAPAADRRGRRGPTRPRARSSSARRRIGRRT